MRIGWIFPLRRLFIAGEKSACCYHFRLGRFLSKEYLSPDLLSARKGTVFLDALIQESYIHKAPKLKFFDRYPFLYQALSHRFKTENWLSYHWLSPRHYLALKVGSVPFSVKDGTRYGILEGELSRLKVFENGEGLILAPSPEGKIREIYLKNHYPHFTRLAEMLGIDWDTEIENLERYLERHYQVNTQTLEIIWWGSSTPSCKKIKSYASTLFEDDLAQSSSQYLFPALKCYPVLSSRLFSFKEIRQFSLLILWVASLFLLISSVRLFKNYKENSHLLVIRKMDLTRKQKELSHARNRPKNKYQESDSEWNVKYVADAYENIVSLTISPLTWLQELAACVGQECRLREFFWGRGQLTIHPSDQSMNFHADILSHNQGLVLGITGPNVDRLQELEKVLGKKFSFASVELWDPQEIALQTQKELTALIHIQSKTDPHENP